MSGMIYYASLFIGKVIDNALSTTKTDPEKSVDSGRHCRNPIRLHLFLDHKTSRHGRQLASYGSSCNSRRCWLLSGLLDKR